MVNNGNGGDAALTCLEGVMSRDILEYGWIAWKREGATKKTGSRYKTKR